MQIHALGMTVRRIHSDRGREFNNDGMKKFCVARSIIKTTTTGDDFKMNGRCESFIGRGKNAVRTLLAAKGLEKKFWSFAFRHHVAKIQNYIMEKLGVARPRLPPFGTKVYVKKRSWKDSAWDERVVPAVVLCPSPDVSRGFLVKDDDGSYMSTMVAVQNVKEVSGEFEVPVEHATEPAPPARRVTGKAHLAKLDAQSEVDDDESCCKAALEDGKFTLADCSDLLMSLHVRNPVGVCVKDQQQVASVSLGMSATGGEPTRPWLTRYLNEVLVRTMPEGAYYTNLEVLYNGGSCLSRRRDCEPGTKCYAIMLGDHVGGDM